MNIAYVSFECPPDTAVGGIATYVLQVAKMMKNRGHHVEVFTASPTRSVSECFEGVLVHRVQTESREHFPKQIVTIFQQRHSEIRFDVLESPEYMGDGYEIKKLFPSLPLVVKLHTPDSLMKQLETFYKGIHISSYTKFRFLLGGWIRGQKREVYWNYERWKQKEKDIEYLITSLADQIHTPSLSLGDIVAKEWQLPRETIIHVPNPFVPNARFLDIPVGGSGNKMVTFMGRLEVRKGIIELIKAVPLILEAVPGSQFQFVGKSMGFVPGMSMKDYISSKLEKYKDRISFLKVDSSQIPGVLKETDVCVFPSIWENFPNVCLEAMSAGKAIVASKEGGMRDMLEQPVAGLLIDPLNHREIADAVIRLLNDKALRVELGKAAREKIVQAYSSERIGSLMEKQYSSLLFP